MSHLVRYSDLMEQAARHIADASKLLAAGPLSDTTETLRAVTAYRRLLAALHRHGWQLLGGDSRQSGNRAAVHWSPVDAAAVQLLDALGVAAGRAVRLDASAQSHAPLPNAWRSAVTCVAAATDLLATHRDSDGTGRSPTAWLLDEPRVRAAGLGALAHTVEAVAGDATTLGLRALQAGVDPRRTRMLARLTATVAPAARKLRTLCSPSAGYAELAEAELARPAVRTDHPMHELADRLARLHRGAWQLMREPHVGVTTLTYYAALGVIVHAHTAALLTTLAGPNSGSRDAAAEPLIAGIKHSGGAWRRLHRQLADLRTATPGSAGVQRDVQRVRALLREHIPLHPAQHTPEPMTVDRQLAATILGAPRSLTAVAGWNAQVIDQLAATRQLHLDGARLTGDEVTNRDDLVAAKLSASLVAVPPDRLLAVRDAYRAVADAQQAESAAIDTIRAAPSATVAPSWVDRSRSRDTLTT
jgi:hypothetical protein